MARRAAETRLRHELLVRPPRLRICGSGPLLADIPFRGPLCVALPHGPGAVARDQESRSQPPPVGFVYHCLVGLRVPWPGAFTVLDPGNLRLLPGRLPR